MPDRFARHTCLAKIERAEPPKPDPPHDAFARASPPQPQPRPRWRTAGENRPSPPPPRLHARPQPRRHGRRPRLPRQPPRCPHSLDRAHRPRRDNRPASRHLHRQRKRRPARRHRAQLRRRAQQHPRCYSPFTSLAVPQQHASPMATDAWKTSPASSSSFRLPSAPLTSSTNRRCACSTRCRWTTWNGSRWLRW